ncbi:MAG: hypothetical protein ACWA44_14200 [Thiotrichales bacterium]
MIKLESRYFFRRKRKNGVLIIGKVPPPVGGVTIHVMRSLDRLRSLNVPFLYLELSVAGIPKILKNVFAYSVIHLHASKPLVRLLIGGVAKLFGTKVFVTYHGNIGRFGFLGNLLDYLSIVLIDLPIVLNEGSLQKAKKLNKCAIKVSAFVAPVMWEPDQRFVSLVSHLRAHCKYLFCTNAFSLARDNKGREIYGILDLLRIFEKRKDLGLIISDPSGGYSKLISDSGELLSSNILFINGEHDFMSVIYASDCFLRATITDGDSISIHEALYLGKSVVASDCVSRPEGVLKYSVGKNKALELALNEVIKKGSHPTNVADGIEQLITLYQGVGIEIGD